MEYWLSTLAQSGTIGQGGEGVPVAPDVAVEPEGPSGRGSTPGAADDSAHAGGDAAPAADVAEMMHPGGPTLQPLYPVTIQTIQM